MKKWKLLERTNKYQMYSNPGQAKNNAINGKLIDLKLIPTKQFLWSHYVNAEWL